MIDSSSSIFRRRLGRTVFFINSNEVFSVTHEILNAKYRQRKRKEEHSLTTVDNYRRSTSAILQRGKVWIDDGLALQSYAQGISVIEPIWLIFHSSSFARDWEEVSRDQFLFFFYLFLMSHRSERLNCFSHRVRRITHRPANERDIERKNVLSA